MKIVCICTKCEQLKVTYSVLVEVGTGKVSVVQLVSSKGPDHHKLHCTNRESVDKSFKYIVSPLSQSDCRGAKSR